MTEGRTTPFCVRRNAQPEKDNVVCMKMNKTKELLLRLLSVLAFATAALAAVNALILSLIHISVYRDNIRGYVPAGIGGMTFLGIATIVLLFYLAGVAKRHRNSAAPYVGIGCLAALLALLGFSIYSTVVIHLLGDYNWRKDVAMASVGAIVFTVMSIVTHRKWLSKQSRLPAGGADVEPKG